MFIWRNRVTVVAAVLTCAPTAFGQVELDRFRRQLNQIQRDTQLAINHGVPATQRALIDYGGYVTFNFLATDDINQKTHLLRETSLNGYTLINFDGAHELFARARSTYRDFNSGDGFSNQNDDWAELMIDRVHYKFNLKQSLEAYEGRSINGNLIIQGGRQLIHWGNGLALSQEIDGGQITVESGRVSLETVVGVTRESTFDIDSSRPGFDGNTQRSFYGGLLSMQTDARHRPYIYGLFQRDRNDDVIASTDVLGTPGDLSDDIRTRFDYDSHYIGIGSTGSIGDRLTYGAEIVYQGGSSLSNSISGLEAGATQLVQQQEQIEAFAVDLRLDYLMTDANRTRVSGEILIASGDTDRLTTTNTLGGNAAGSDDRAFNGFGLLNTGLAFNPNAPTELWITSPTADQLTVIQNPGKPEQQQVYFRDFSMHFLEQAISLSFSDDQTFGTCGNSNNSYDGLGDPNYFMGPALWPANTEDFYKYGPDAANVHLDMLHSSPFCMGIAAQGDGSKYFVFNGHDGVLDWYDFKAPHPDKKYGGEDHTDGVKRRYFEVQLKRAQNTPSHMLFDKASRWLYIADTGNRRILRVNVDQATKGQMLQSFPFDGILFAYQGVVQEDFVSADTNILQRPSGLALHDGILYVTDAQNGVIHAFDAAGKIVRYKQHGNYSVKFDPHAK